MICALALRAGFVPAGVNTRTVDPALPVNYLLANQAAPLQRVMSNSFGFGGSNCSLVLGRALMSALPLSGCIEGVGVLGPGIGSWPAAAAILSGRTAWVSRTDRAAAARSAAAAPNGAARARS